MRPSGNSTTGRPARSNRSSGFMLRDYSVVHFVVDVPEQPAHQPAYGFPQAE